MTTQAVQADITSNEAAYKLDELARKYGYAFERAAEHRFEISTEPTNFHRYTVVHDTIGILVEPGQWIATYYAGKVKAPVEVWGGTFNDVVKFLTPSQ